MDLELFWDFEFFVTNSLYDMFCEADRFVYDHCGVSDTEEALSEWMKNDSRAYRALIDRDSTWSMVYNDLYYETRILFFQYTWFLVKNHRPIDELSLLTDKEIDSYPLIRQKLKKLDRIQKELESQPHPLHVSLSRYLQTKIQIDRAHISSAAKLLYSFFEKYLTSYQKREELFKNIIQSKHPEKPVE